ncbi:MAG: right-handed parallel beta-helix repeat-containing protein [Verrucomicrobiota bacterium]
MKKSTHLVIACDADEPAALCDSQIHFVNRSQKPDPISLKSILSCGAVKAFCLLIFVVLGGRLRADTPVVRHSDSWRYRKGASAPQSGWKTASDANLDASWQPGNGGFGYADNAGETLLCQTILSDMRGNYSTVTMRRSFDIGAPVDPAQRLILTADWDDGFIAWLDGIYLASANSPGAPNEPPFNASATSSHESSRGDSSAELAMVYDLGLVGSRLGVGTHILAIMGVNSSLSGSSDFVQIVDLAIGAPQPANCVGGPISTNTIWNLASSPIVVCSNVTIEDGSTLTIEPGVTVQFIQGVGLTVANGGRLLAYGNETNQIRFTREASATRWGGLAINGTVGSPETRISYARFESNGTTAIHSLGGTVFLDHLYFDTHDHQYVSLDDSSFVVRDCEFPTGTAKFELVHGTGGIKSGGHGIIQRNFFGKTTGYSDVVDFTGGNRPGPIVHFINNVFTGSDDDGIDLDGTDAWIEGNIFLHIHRNGDTPDSSAAISGGDNGGNTSELTIVGNLFFDCDNAITAKQGNFFTLFKNTIVHMTKTGGIDGDSGAVNVRDTTPSPTRFARGAYLEGNIIWDIEQLVRNYDPAQTTVTLNDNLLPTAWNGPGTGNQVADPMLKHIPSVSEAVFSTWKEAQVMRDWFSLQTNSPAISSGPNSLAKGGVIALGVSLAGVPTGLTDQTNATLNVGVNRTGGGIPNADWPEGAGYTRYRWRLDGGAWSDETAIGAPISLSGLADGPHDVEVVGLRDSGLYQNDPLFGDDALVTRSETWTVQTSVTRFSAVTRTGEKTTLTFRAQVGNTYSVLHRDAFDAAHPWGKLRDIPSQATTGSVTVEDADVRETGFYLLVSPALP